MLFNSLEFAIFLPLVLILYWVIGRKNIKAQNVLLVVSGYVFYGWWDWHFLFLIAFSSVVDFWVGQTLEKNQNNRQRQLLLALSLLMNLGLLGFFKYYNFFVESFVDAFTLFGKKLEISTLKIILPVGISFYTFQTLSYSIDVYRKKLKPTHDIIAFFAYVSFFPQLVAGPIERATNLLPQFSKKRKFEYSEASDGIKQIIYGLFKKVVIADTAAEFANIIFENYTDYSGSMLLLGAFYFAIQIYGDFSGYSDIAIGTARLFGFTLMKNFAFPYFSRDIAEFWRRWHISLSTWFRDYLYIPLGGSRGSTVMKVRNTFIIFIVSGFWHGANWTFIVWGALNAVYFLPLLLLKRNRKNTDLIAEGKLFPKFRELVGMSITFFLTVIAWIFFRAKDISTAIHYTSNIFNSNLLSIPNTNRTPLPLIFFFLFWEWFHRNKEHGLDHNNLKNKWLKRFILYIFVIMIALFGTFINASEFIYFQF